MRDVLLASGLILLLILLNGAFSGSELAVVSLREGQIQRLEGKGVRGRRLADLARDPTRLLTAVQIGITLAGFLASAAATRTLTERAASGLDFLGGAADLVAILLTTLVLTYFTLVLGELVPKRLAMQRAERWGLLAAGPISRLATITRPAVWLLSRSTDALVRLLGGDPGARQEVVTEEEVRDLIATQIHVSPQQREILSGAFEAAERTLREIVVPRSSVLALATSTDASVAMHVLAASGHTRAPVYVENLDQAHGVVHLIDLIDAPGTVADHERPVLLLPETVGVLDALRRLKAGRQQMAVVVNEHGGTEGIVTLEDLLEEIVGDLYDEFDPDLAKVERDADGVLLMPGDYPVHDLEDIDIHLPDGPYTTVAGYTLSKLGHLPEVGEWVEADGWRIEVLAVEGRAITRLRFTPATPD